jgi:hypothetical protein
MPFLHDLYEWEAKQSPIVSLPIHTNRVKKDKSFFAESLGGLITTRCQGA